MQIILIIIAFLIPSIISAQWSSNSTQNNPICTETGDQVNQSIVSDGKGGAIICWEDRRNVSDWNIYAQRIDSSGNVIWNGIPICSAASYQYQPQILKDDSNNVIVAWTDIIKLSW